jgi:predicted kinase
LSEQDFSSNDHKDPWLIFTVGAQGAGKQYVVEHLVEDRRLSLNDPVTVDMDEIRRRLPEYTWFLKQVPDKLDELTKTECGYISETLTYAALQQGRDVFFDSFLHNGDWYTEFIDSIRTDCEQMNGVRVALIHVEASIEVIMQRVEKVSKETGRHLSKETVLRQLDCIQRSLEIVSPVVDELFTIENNDDIVLKSASWSVFAEAFDGTSKLNRLQLSRLISDESTNQDHKECRTRHRRSKRGSFIILRSTEENYQLNALEFRGKFASIRKTLDYTYHSNYTFERQRLQDRIIQDFLDKALVRDKNGEVCTTPTEPWIVFTAGAMGAGKESTA